MVKLFLMWCADAMIGVGLGLREAMTGQHAALAAAVLEELVTQQGGRACGPALLMRCGHFCRSSVDGGCWVCGDSWAAGAMLWVPPPDLCRPSALCGTNQRHLSAYVDLDDLCGPHLQHGSAASWADINSFADGELYALDALDQLPVERIDVAETMLALADEVAVVVAVLDDIGADLKADACDMSLQRDRGVAVQLRLLRALRLAQSMAAIAGEPN